MIVLDTNVVAEAMRPEPHPGVLGWLNNPVADTLFLSSVTLAEVLFGIAALPEGAGKHRLARAFDRLVALFANRVLASDQEGARRCADMAAAARAAGRPLPAADGYLAATAAAHGFAVATHTVQHFQDTGVELINPRRAD